MDTVTKAKGRALNLDNALYLSNCIDWRHDYRQSLGSIKLASLPSSVYGNIRKHFNKPRSLDCTSLNSHEEDPTIVATVYKDAIKAYTALKEAKVTSIIINLDKDGDVSYSELVYNKMLALGNVETLCSIDAKLREKQLVIGTVL